jgi:C4-dicarboxylate-specific signal transduction histidine kinase
MFRERGGFIGRLYESKSPIHIPDFDAEIHLAGEAEQLAVEKKHGLRTFLIVPMLRNDELIGSISLARLRVEPFTEKEIELMTDFAAEAAIALEITRRERQLRELQRELAHANRVVTMEQLAASITHEVNQPIAAARNNVIAALHFLDRNPPDLQEVREALACAAEDTDRAGAVVSRMRALMQKASPRSERVDINEAVHEVIELTRGEALKNGVSVKTEFAKGLPIITCDRVQLQQVVLNLILNALQAMGGDREGARQVLITTSQTGSNDPCIGIQDRSTRQSPTAWDWDWQSAARSSKPTAGACGPPVASHTGLSFSLLSLFVAECPLMALSGHPTGAPQCPLSGGKADITRT